MTGGKAAARYDLGFAAAVVSLLVLAFAILSWLPGVGVPLLLACALGYALNPAVTFLERRRWPRALGAAALFLLLASLLGGGALLVAPTFERQAGRLPDLIARAGAELLPAAERVTGLPLPQLVRDRATELAGEASGMLRNTGPALARALASVAGNTARAVGTVFALLLVPVLAFLLVKDYPRLIGGVRELLPRPAEALLVRRFSELDRVLSSFVRGQLTVGALLSVVYAAGLSAARIELAVVIGVITGFGNMVPYVGTGAGIALSLVSALLGWQGGWQLLVIAATFLAAQLLEGLVLTPRIVGGRVGLAPIVVILAVLTFGQLFGLVGVLLAVPSTAALKVVLDVLIEQYRRSRWYTGQA